jgi:hypothetical protein
MMALHEKPDVPFGMRLEKVEGGIVFLRCVHCQCSYPAPLGYENQMTCQAPGCLKKRRTE